MKILILGQPRSGKSTLTRILSEQLNFPTISTDSYRRKWGFHKPHNGYDTEIEPSKQLNFYNRLKEICEKYDNLILEGSAINPKDSYLFDPDIVILLSRKNITVEKMLEDSRRYDDDWTKLRDDKYLYNLFQNYKSYSQKWEKANKDILVDTTNYLEGIENAKNIIIDKIEGIKNIK